MNDALLKWFGKSKIVDSNGEPLICYHGSNYKFNEFDKSYIGLSNDNGYYGRGFYFTYGETGEEDLPNSSLK